jgi:uncharacterized integral membrane protein
MIAIIAFVVILALVTVFSVQNAMPVAITFFFWKFEASLAIVIFLSFLSGCILTGIIVLLRRLRRPTEAREKGPDVEGPL